MTLEVAHHDDPFSVYGIARPDRQLLVVYAVRTALLCLIGPWFAVAFIPLYFKYKTLSYRFDDEGVGMAWGLLWRREIYLTYARIQDIHLSRGVIERWFGIATIQVQTASGSSSAEMSIVGLTTYEVVRDFLYSRMRGAQLGHDAKSASAYDADSDELLPLLTEIRDELRAIRKLCDRSEAP